MFYAIVKMLRENISGHFTIVKPEEEREDTEKSDVVTVHQESCRESVRVRACDFFTIDTILGKRFYVFFILYMKTREIMQYAVTESPCREFVRQQLMEFSESIGIVEEKVYLIHDRSPELCCFHYEDYGVQDVTTSRKAPKMNAIAERFIRSVRNEVLDAFVEFGKKHIEHLLLRYVLYFNELRPHHGIEQRVPGGYEVQTEGKIVSIPILSGLHHHYERRSA